MIASALLALALAAPAQGAGTGRIRFAELEISGPLDGARARTAGGELVLAERTVAGEQRVVLAPVPVPVEGPGREIAPEFELYGAGAGGPQGGVRFVRWTDDEREQTWRELGPALARRGRPRAPVAGAGYVGPGLALAAAALVIGLAVRKRAWPMLAAGALVSYPVVAWPTVFGPWLRGATLIESLGSEGPVVVVGITRFEQFLVNPVTLDGLLCAETRPSSAPLLVRSNAGVQGGCWSLAVPGAELVTWRWSGTAGRGAAPPELRPTENAWMSLEQAWLRDGGGWGYLGTWRRGAQVPATFAGSSAGPPPWLAAGLPAAERTLLARVGENLWLRWVGFPRDLRSTQGSTH